LKKLFILGKDISYTLSPKIYNRLFVEKSIDAQYTVVEAPTEQDAVRSITNCRNDILCLGFNVTKPYKLLAYQHVDQLDEHAARIGAINTVARLSYGELKGYNTDWLGVIEPLEKLDSPAKYDVLLLIGAGGAARAALYALQSRVRKAYIVSRTGVTAQQLARKAGIWGIDAKGMKASSEVYVEILPRTDLLINATPASTDTFSPIPRKILDKYLHQTTTVFDMVYKPLDTLLLQIAKSKGCKVVDGLWMLVHQAKHNIKIWFGLEVCAKLLRRYALS